VAMPVAPTPTSTSRLSPKAWRSGSGPQWPIASWAPTGEPRWMERKAGYFLDLYELF
jgi:uncharacterized protein YraI